MLRREQSEKHVLDTLRPHDQHLDVGCLGLALEPLHAPHELDDVDDTVHVPVEQLEEPVDVVVINVQGVHELADITFSVHAVQELVACDHPIARLVDLLEEIQQVVRGGFALLQVLLNHHDAVPLHQLDGAVHENACDDVQDGEEVDEDIDHHEETIGLPGVRREVRNLTPIAAAGHAFEQRIHRCGERTKRSVQVLDDLWRSIPRVLGLQVHRGALRQHERKAVAVDDKDHEEPENRTEGRDDHAAHYPELDQAACGAEEAQHAPDAYDAQHLSDGRAAPGTR
mmetsp:Transcript_43602/g.86663  ORF Transcript_43602/g.86663 Transcript_43602/m.86663 type:complete len:284 (+) Transcript_43602:334-1185(+)